MEEFYLQAAKWLIKFESFAPKAMWDVNAWRIGHGSDTITFPDGTFRKVLKTDTTTLEMAGKDLQRRIRKDFEPIVIKQVGKEFYYKLPVNARIALISFAYNYGTLIKKHWTDPMAIVKAARTGNVNTLGKTIYDITANDNKGVYFTGLRKRRKMEWDLAISPNELDKKLIVDEKKTDNSSNLFFFTIIAAAAIFFLLAPKK